MNLNTADNKYYSVCLSLDVDKIDINDAFKLTVMDHKAGGYILEIYAGAHANAIKEFDALCEIYDEPYQSEKAFKAYLEAIAQDIFDYTALTVNDVGEKWAKQ
jgi:hypothetical protein